MLPSIEKDRNLGDFRSFKKNHLLMLLGFFFFGQTGKLCHNKKDWFKI